MVCELPLISANSLLEHLFSLLEEIVRVTVDVIDTDDDRHCKDGRCGAEDVISCDFTIAVNLILAAFALAEALAVGPSAFLVGGRS